MVRHADFIPAARVHVALDASCGTLVTLESLLARADGQAAHETQGEQAAHEARAAIQQAVKSLRVAIAALRCGDDDEGRVLPGEFVLAEEVSHARRDGLAEATPARSAQRIWPPAPDWEVRAW